MTITGKNESLTKEDQLYKTLLRELIVSVGCTEPAAIAYNVSIAATHISMSDLKSAEVLLSESVYKNAHAVPIPKSQEKGIPYIVALGLVLRETNMGLSLFERINEEHLIDASKLVESNIIQISIANEVENDFYIQTKLVDSENTVEVITQEHHTNIYEVKLNTDVIYQNRLHGDKQSENLNNCSIEELLLFSKNSDHEKLGSTIKAMIQHNYSFAKKSFDKYGNLFTLTQMESGVIDRIVAITASSSFSRMSGDNDPVVINSGSGNQGLCVSIPVIEYANSIKSSEDDLHRALIFSNLLAIELKKSIGYLSAYCGVVTATTAGVAGIAYLQGLTINQMDDYVKNSLSICSGMFCDGAKVSCAAKIHSALYSSLLALRLVKKGVIYEENDGVIGCNAQSTMENISEIVRNSFPLVNSEIVKVISEEKT